MNPRTKKKMDRANLRLTEYNQKTRLIELTSTALTLNTGIVLYGNNANKFIKRVMNLKITEWVKNIDNLLGGIVTEAEIKSLSFAIGGRACQKIHGEKIKQNLNNGIPWNKGKKELQIGWAKGLTQHTDDRIKQFAKFGEKNGMFGVKMSDENKVKHSKRMKDSILNGSFTPNTNNRNTHWDAIYLERKYRSSWEAWYQYIDPESEYETLRIEYTLDDIRKIYIVDFVNHRTKTVVEVKPIELTSTKEFKAKWEALSVWAQENKYVAILATKNWLVQHTTEMNYSFFDPRTADKIRKLYETSKKN